MSHHETKKNWRDDKRRGAKEKKAVQIVWVYEYAMAQWWRKQESNDKHVYPTHIWQQERSKKMVKMARIEWWSWCEQQ